MPIQYYKMLLGRFNPTQPSGFDRKVSDISKMTNQQLLVDISNVVTAVTNAYNLTKEDSNSLTSGLQRLESGLTHTASKKYLFKRVVNSSASKEEEWKASSREQKTQSTIIHHDFRWNPAYQKSLSGFND